MKNVIQCCVGAALVFGFTLAGPRPLGAQRPAERATDFSSLYGQGVNAYFAGRSSEAESYLSQALALNPQDPRAYYFRALSLMRLGRLDEARGDMMVGASLEARRPGRYRVGRALERVQGGHRLTLEQYRRQGRTFSGSTANVGTPVQTQPSPAEVDSDSYVLRRRVVVPIDRLLDEEGPQALSADELADRRRRMVSRPVPPVTRPAESPANTTLGDDPFRDDPDGAIADEAAQAEALSQPASSQPAAMADEPAGGTAAEPPVEAEENPFDEL